jgi:hypothetical protein
MNEVKHEIKFCKRCQSPFECKLGSITECQCFAIQLTWEELRYVEKSGFKDCLCIDCLRILQKEHYLLLRS